METQQTLRKCSRCHSTILLKYFTLNRQGGHMKTCDNCKSKHKCQQCEYKCSTKSKLLRHTKAVHNKIKDIERQQCEYKCCRKSSLLQHTKYHCHKGDTRPCSSGEKKVMDVLTKYEIDFIHDGNHNGLRSFEDKGYLRFDFYC